ncbi:unnamed protein product [Cercospora beticola]|nr:unnamed protein product [Cercospora beticola]
MEADSIFGRPSTCGIPSEPSEDDVQKFFSESKLDSTMLQCSVHSSTYTANFEFVDGAQEVHFELLDVSEQTLDTIWSITGLPKDAPELYSDPSVPAPCNHLGGYDRGEACIFDSTVLRNMSYTAILYAYLELIIGSLEFQDDAESGRRLSMNSGIASTALVQSPELEWIDDLSILDETWSALQQLSKGPTITTGTRATFHNITISLFSEPELNYNESSAFRPNETEVTFATRNIIYVYTRQKLWLAYGISIGVTLLTVLFGLTAIFANKACFSHEFSTYLRLSRGAELSIGIKQEDLYGKDPLPAYAGRAVIRFGRQADVADYQALPRSSDYEGKVGTLGVTAHDLSEAHGRQRA